MLRSSRLGAHIVTAVALVCSTVGAPEHIHEADAAFHTSVAHRHLEPHHDAASIGDTEARIVWLNEVAVHQVTQKLDPPAAVLAIHTGVTLDFAGWFVAGRDAPTPAHGPPRSSPSLRAPPTFRLI